MNDLSGQQWENTRLVPPAGPRRLRRGPTWETHTLKMPAAVRSCIPTFPRRVQHLFYMRRRTVAGLLHPHIVRVLDFDHGSTTLADYGLCSPWFAAAKYPYGTTVPLAQASSYVHSSLLALQYAHGPTSGSP